MTTEREKPHWTVDKRIPLTSLAVAALNVVIFVVTVTTMYVNFKNGLTDADDRIGKLEEGSKMNADQLRRITILETRSENTAATLTQIQSTVNSLNSKIDLFLVRTATTPHNSPGQ